MRMLTLLTATLLASTLGGTAASAQDLSAEEQAIVEYIDAHAEDAIALLERVVNINSGTMNLDGVREVGRVFDSELAALGFRTRWVPMDSVNRAGHLFAERRGGQGWRLLLIGHLDTVFEEDSPFQRFEREGSTATGPGVSDMKGGDVVILLALQALHAAGVLEGTSVIVALTGDEEHTGDPLDYAREHLREAALRSDVALGFEGNVGGVGQVTVARRGFTGWTLRVTGRPAHSSQIFRQDLGSGAIFEAARILNEFHEELKGEEYLTFNPGMILGGTTVDFEAELSRGSAFGKTNVIAETAVVIGDLRALSELQRERAKERMEDIVEESLPHTEATISFRDSYPPMEPTGENYALMEMLSRVNRDLGYGEVTEVDPGRRGAADISFVADVVEASLSGLGVIGEGAHTERETVDLGSIPVMAKRAALLMYRLTRE